ncbi:sterol desaturase family protein [Candidatus Uhrbacteria bacterium]|nr:MAG: sterol desaturase family protein [Candidatus Uhrbacteria bacterium]
MTRTILIILGLYAILGVFEYFFPAERGQTARGRLRNLIFTGMFLLMGGIVVGWLFSVVPIPTRLVPKYSLTFSILIVLFYLFLGDLIFYWYHRAQHAWRWLWPIHELHHADRELNATTSMRTYWLERPIQTALIVTPVEYFLGLDATAAAIVPFAALGWLFFSHANWRLELGRFTPVIVGPQLHRVHHSILPHHQHKNFAQFFPVLDIIFGTYYRPANSEFPPTGTQELASDAPILETLARPVKLWAASVRTRSRRS